MTVSSYGVAGNKDISEMLYAAKHGKIFHLWWHPHNFSTHTEKNIENLEKVLAYYEVLHDKYGFESMNMGEVATDVMK